MAPRVFAVVALAFVACSSSAEDRSPPPPASETPKELHPAFHFVSERDGFARDVSSIVYTDRFHVRVDGLLPSTEVSVAIRTYSPGRKGRGYFAEATFVADAEGRVDTSKLAPARGSYAGVDPDGLVWSATEGPLEEGLGERTSAFFSAKVGEDVVATATLARLVTSADVRVEPVTDDGLVAELFMPAGANDRVPIVAFGGSEGGIRGGQTYASRIASWGYPVLAVAYFGAQGVPTNLVEVPLEYFAKAFAYLDRRPEMRKGKVIVVGSSRGGELALLLGATFPSVVGVIADTPSSYRWAGVSTDGKAAWTYQGKALPFVPSSNATPDVVAGPSGTQAWALRSGFEKDIRAAPPAALEAARVAVENAAGPILMFGGADDGMWPACEFMNRAMAHLDQSGHSAKHHDEAVCFPETGHAVGMLGLPTADAMWAVLGGELYSLGGSAAGAARAGRERDARVHTFLDRLAK